MEFVLKKIKTRYVMLSLVTLTVVYFSWSSHVEDNSPHVARIAIRGQIEDSQELIERIERISRDDSAKALIVSLSSPGGSAYAGEAIFRAIQKVKNRKPVITEVHEMAASAGYLISCASNIIVAAETSLVGSIGVLFQYPYVKPFLDKLGVSIKSVKSSPMKAEPSPFSEVNPKAVQMMKDVVDSSYHWFVRLVSESRNIPYDKTLVLSDGRIWTGAEAKKVGLIDVVGGQEEVWQSLYALGVDQSIRKIKDWNPPKNYWFCDLKNLSISSLLEDTIPLMKQTKVQGLWAVWNP
ncbi:signal peptide peptidase SppA [Candidatus Liberibacter asiaticus]|nr:signal peptide peptidase SppA [Candidatus Liberibacter asiaticus]